MFGYACDETTELMPLPIQMAHHLVKQLSDIRRTSKLTYLRPDGKSQVSVEYVDGQPKRIDAVVISTQHDDDVTTEQLRADARSLVATVIAKRWEVQSSRGIGVAEAGSGMGNCCGARTVPEEWLRG